MSEQTNDGRTPATQITSIEEHNKAERERVAAEELRKEQFAQARTGSTQGPA